MSLSCVHWLGKYFLGLSFALQFWFWVYSSDSIFVFWLKKYHNDGFSVENIKPWMTGIWIWEENLDERKGGMKTEGGRECACKDGDERACSESGSQKIIFSHRAAQAFVNQSLASIRSMWVSIFRDPFLSWMARRPLSPLLLLLLPSNPEAFLKCRLSEVTTSTLSPILSSSEVSTAGYVVMSEVWVLAWKASELWEGGRDEYQARTQKWLATSHPLLPSSMSWWPFSRGEINSLSWVPAMSFA